jgi:hypothetical protein
MLLFMNEEGLTHSLNSRLVIRITPTSSNFFIYFYFFIFYFFYFFVGHTRSRRFSHQNRAIIGPRIIVCKTVLLLIIFNNDMILDQVARRVMSQYRKTCHFPKLEVLLHLPNIQPTAPVMKWPLGYAET